MRVLNDLFRDIIVLAIGAIVQHGFTVKDMAVATVKAHEKGLTRYGAYSKVITGY
ncbi:MAG: hypothetical protein VX642_14410 [Bdellovibrionota bacterium]|nr:hypothetical protein [Bdellovibrionota bacterium]